MADWGLYSALRGHDDWAQKRNDAAMALGIAQERENRSQIALQRQMQMEEGMQQAFDELARLDVLEQDAGRIKELETEQRKRIVQGVAKYNGDLTKYMSSGGIRDLHNYKNSILQSEVYKKAISNKGNLQQYLKDRTDGKYIKSSVVEVPTTDEKTGKQVMRPMKLSFAQQMKLFQDGVIDQLNYGGAEDKIKIDPNKYQNVYKNSLNPYQPDNLVSMSNIYESAILDGAGEEQAQYLAQEYGQAVQGGMKPYTFKAGDISELRLKQQEAARKEEMHQARLAKLKGGGGSGGGGAQYLNIFGTRMRTMPPGTDAKLTAPEREILINDYLTPVTKKNSDGVFSALDPGNALYTFNGDAFGPDMKTLGDISKGKIIGFPQRDFVVLPNGEPAMAVIVTLDDNDPAINDPNYYFDRPNEKFKDASGKSQVQRSGFFDEDYTTTFYIPVGATLGNQFSRTVNNTKLGVKDNQTNKPSDFDDDAEIMDAYNRGMDRYEYDQGE